MRILHLSTNDTAGGAARAAYRLHQGLRHAGHDSRMLVMNRSSDDPSVVAFRSPRHPLARVRRHLRRQAINADVARYQGTRPAGLEPFSDDRSMHGADLMAQIPGCDVINLHWVAGFIDLAGVLPALARRAPLVWRLSDSNPFTGGCHYDDGCERFTQQCGACPQLGSRDANDLSRQVHSRKRQALARIPHGRLQIVALSRWIADEARRSSLFRDLPISVIPNGIDTHIFAPGDRAAARTDLAIPHGAQVVMFSAGSVNNRRKGFAELVAALAGISAEQQVVLLSLGGGKPVINAPLQHIHLGHLADDRQIAAAYSAADLFVIPSLQENLPNTALEAMACGIPVVGFDAGGIPDLVRHRHTGLLAPVGDISGLRQQIQILLDAPDLRGAFGAAGREVVVREYTPATQVARYLSLYEQSARQNE